MLVGRAGSGQAATFLSVWMGIGHLCKLSSLRSLSLCLAVPLEMALLWMFYSLSPLFILIS